MLTDQQCIRMMAVVSGMSMIVSAQMCTDVEMQYLNVTTQLPLKKIGVKITPAVIRHNPT